MIAAAPNFAYIDKPLPANIDAEEAVLGAILFDKEVIDTVFKILPPEAFSLVSHRHIYKAFLAMQEEGIPIDMTTACAWLTDHDLLEAVGGQNKIAQLFGRVISTANTGSYAELVHEKYLRRQLIEAGERLRELAFTSDFSSAIAEGESLLCQIERMQRGSPKERLLEEIKAIREIDSPVAQWFRWNQLEKRSKHKKRSLIELALAAEADSDLEVYSAREFAELKFAEAKYLIGGLIRQGTVALIAAEAKTGKSLFHYNLAYHAATGESWGDFLIENKYKTLIVQTDESQIEAQERIICRGLSDLPNVEIVTRFSPFQLSRLRKKIIADKIQFVIFDSLTSINRTSGYSPNDAEYGYFCYELKEMAEELGISILLVHHTNKCPVEMGLDKIAGSATITRAVSDIFILSRSKQQEDPETTRILYHAASRSGGQKTWKIDLSPEDFSWSVEGRCNLEGAADQSGDNSEKGEVDQSLQIQNLLRASGEALEIQEISRSLNLPVASVRRICGTLSRQLRIGRRRSQVNRRAYVYFWPEASDHASDQVITSDHSSLHDHLHDHFRNPHSEPNQALSDQVITKNSQKNISESEAMKNFEENKRSHDHLDLKPLQDGKNTSDHGSDHASPDDHLITSDDHLTFKAGDRILADWGKQKDVEGEVIKILKSGNLAIRWLSGKCQGTEGAISPNKIRLAGTLAAYLPECMTPTEARKICAEQNFGAKSFSLPWKEEELEDSYWINIESRQIEFWAAMTNPRKAIASQPLCRIDHLDPTYQAMWSEWIEQ